MEEWVGGKQEWKMPWRRKRLMWESTLEQELLQVLQSKSLIDGTDVWVWKENIEGVFLVRFMLLENTLSSSFNLQMLTSC